MLPVCLPCGEFYRVGHECSAELNALHALSVGKPADEVAEERQLQADSTATIAEIKKLIVERA